MKKHCFIFQRKALDATKSLNRVLLALDMGLGKTFTGLTWFNEKNPNGICIILCQKNKIKDWYDETKSIFSDWDIIQIKSQNHLSNLLKDGLDNKTFLIMSHSMFALYSTKNLKWWNVITLDKSFIFDESQGLRTRNSGISKHTFSLSKVCEFVLLLSGDPFPNGYKDGFTQLKILRIFPDSYTWSGFLRDWCETFILPNTYVPIIRNYKNTNELKALLKYKSYFLTTKDAIGLPEENWVNHKLDSNSSYKKFAKHKVLNIDDKEIVSNGILSEMTILRQLSSGFAKVDGTPVNLSIDKLSLLNDLIESTKEPLVVFYNFKYERDMIMHHYNSKSDFKFIRIDGEMNEFYSKTNYQDINKRLVFLIQYQAGAKGIDGLQKYCNRIIYYSPPLSNELFKQSMKRIHRLGQERSCFYHLIIASNLEERIYKTLKDNKDFTLSMFESLKIFK